MKRPTIADLAREAGVGVATVDRVLNGRLPVREDTAQRVHAAAERIGFHASTLLRQRAQPVPRRSFGFLLQRRNSFYTTLGEALVGATRANQTIDGRPTVEFTDSITPTVIAANLLALAERVDAVALIAIDHPTVNAAIEQVAAMGKPVLLLLSDVTAPSRLGCVTVDRHKSGRTAGWTISRLAHRPGKVGIFIGSHRYLSQEISEISFRNYLREHAPHLTPLETLLNLDDHDLSYEVVSTLISSVPDLVGIYDCGGGEHGLIQALREEDPEHRIITVCNGLTPLTREALIDGTVDLVLGTPVQTIAQLAVELMAQAVGAPQGAPVQLLLPADLHISESV